MKVVLVKKCLEEEHIDLLLIVEEGRRHYVLIKDFNIFMYGQALHHGIKHFYCYCLQAFSTEEKLECHVEDCFKIKTNGEQRIKMPKKGEYVRFKNCERKIRSPFMIYADFEISKTSFF